MINLAIPIPLLGGLPNLGMSGGEHDRRVKDQVEYSLSGDRSAFYKSEECM